MWQEHERWRQKVRVVVFVAALSALLIAWWRVSSDPRSLPSVFSVDGFFGGPEPNPPAAAAPPAPDRSNVRSGGPIERSPGVGGTGRGEGVPRAAPVSPSAGGREMAAGVTDDERNQQPSPRRGGRRGARDSDCVSDPDTPATSTGGRPTPADD